MRILITATMPHEQFNAALRDGTAGQKLNRILEETKPEAVYFTDHDGKRAAVLIVELPDPSKIPAICEPWFLTFNADVHVKVVMTPEVLAKAGLDKVAKKWL